MKHSRFTTCQRQADNSITVDAVRDRVQCRRRHHWLSLGMSLAVCMLLCGCLNSIRPRNIEERYPDKDVVVRLVELDGVLEPESYDTYAREHLRETPLTYNSEQRASLQHALQQDSTTRLSPPVYEVLYSFHNGRELLATVHYRRSTQTPGELGPLEHLRTQVYGRVE